VADQDRRVEGLRSQKDQELQSHKDSSKGQLVEQERRIRDLERKLNDAQRKLYDRQMLKLGTDEFSVKHICSTQTMQEAMILLRRGIVCRAQSTSWREFFCFNPWVTTRMTLKASTTERGKLDFDLCFLSKLAVKKCYCPLLNCGGDGSPIQWKKLGQAEGPFFIKRMLKLSELDRVRLRDFLVTLCAFAHFPPLSRSVTHHTPKASGHTTMRQAAWIWFSGMGKQWL
jgi:hypothetical protein